MVQTQTTKGWFGRRSRAGVFNPRESPGGRNDPTISVVERAMTAAGVQVTPENAASMRRLIQPWQQRSLAYYDLCGEAWFASQFYARNLSQIRLFVGTYDESGEITEVQNSSEATALLDRIRDPGGTGRSSLQESYGRLMFLTGEGYLIASQPEGEEERWEFLSSDELRVNGDGSYMRYSAPSMTAETYVAVGDDTFVPIEGTSAVVYRLWKKHPRYSAWADSPMKSVLDLFDELILLQQAVGARVKSRLSAAGLLLWPEEATLPSQDVQKSDEDALDDPLLNELVAAANAAIREPGTASAVIPIIARVPAEFIDRVRHLQFFDPNQAYPETGLRKECIERIAMGLDMPPEILLGMSDANHWTSWQIDETTARAHVFPICQKFVDDLTTAYFRPAARAANIQGWENLLIHYDASAIVVAPDRLKDATEMFRDGELSGDALRDAGGFDKEDGPSQEERNRYLGIHTRDSGLAVYGIPTTRAGAGVETAPGEITPGQGARPGDKTSPSGVTKGPPPAQPDGTPMVATAGTPPEVERVLGAAQLSVMRARGLAGSRLRSKFTDPLSYDGVANHDLAARMGADNVSDSLGLVRNATAELNAMMRTLGWSDATADGFCHQVEVFAAQTLTDSDPPSLPDGIRVLLLEA